MNPAWTTRRQRPQEFLLPSGKKIVASLPEDVDWLRQKYGNQNEVQVEVVIHGSEEHANYLRQTRDHHQGRRERLRERHGADFDEWENVQNQLSHVTTELDRLANNASGLSTNFDKFGYGAELRTYDDADSPSQPLSSAASASETLSVGSSSRGEPRVGETTKLFKRPVVKQWFHKGLLWRASEQTEIMAIELFFDLLYVGIIEINGEHASAEPTGAELLRFVITFMMTWKIWSDITIALSWFETDDIFTRVEILYLLACLLGLTTNMTNAFTDNPEHNTYTMLVSFYLAARLKTVLHYVVTGHFLPMIKGMMISESICIVVPSVLWIASIHVSMPARLGLIWVALCLDHCGQFAIWAMFGYGQRMENKNRLGSILSKFYEFFPAINIEHRAERTNAFVSLVLGYSVVGIIFQSNGGYTVNAFLGKAVLGLVQAFIVNWIYFDVDGGNIDVHAIRSSHLTAAIWTAVHLPFVMSYILASAGLSKLVLAADTSNTSAEQVSEHDHERVADGIAEGIRFFYCHGLAIALLAMGFISWSHTHRKPASMRVPKYIRLANRMAVCIVLFLLPISKTLNSLQLISITTCMLAWVLFVELFGKSCCDDPFIGERKDFKLKYSCKCTKKDLEKVRNAADQPEAPKTDVLELGKREKTAVPTIKE